MSLDLTKTALQIDSMASDLKARQSQRELRLQKSLEAVSSLNIENYEQKRQQSKSTLAWSLPGLIDEPGSRYEPPSVPIDYSVAAVDGSHIEIDRHIPARCFLINIGVSVLTYGSQPDARLFSEPRLYARDDELVIRDEAGSHRDQVIQGPVLATQRMVEEVRALAQVLTSIPPDVPTLALMDGSLIVLGLIGHGYRDFVLRHLVEEGFVRSLEDLRQLASGRPVAVASYISLPGGADVSNALRLELCPYETANCAQFCGNLEAGRRPCDEGTWGLVDREILSEILAPGERSAVFVSSSSIVSDYYGGQDICFFYVHAGEEIGRVEVPSWVAADESLLGLTHSLVLDQCRKGPGYPIALMEAHEQAVVTGADRRHFAQLVENALDAQRLPVCSSQKSMSKRLRWL